MTGLHLHGVVYNHPTLLTLPPAQVNEVAADFGFIETAYTVLQSVDEVKQFRQSVVDNGGMWKGEHVEGFVVRAAIKPGSLDKQPQPNDLTEDNWSDERRVFMWKIKFDEPYLMWREWRETTKKILTEKKKAGDDVAARGRQQLEEARKCKSTLASTDEPKRDGKAHLEEAFKKATLGTVSTGKARATDFSAVSQEGPGCNSAMGDTSVVKGQERATAAALPSSIRLDRIRNPETRLYAIWVEKYMETNPEAFVEYQDNRGIISVREAFLKWRSTTKEGQDLHAQMMGKKEGSTIQKTGAFEKTLLVPVAVPGCGKTAIAVALTSLFGFAHTQSDDVKEKKAAKHFENNVAKLLESHPVVIADKYA